MIEHARKQIKKQEQDDSALDLINDRIKKRLSTMLHISKNSDEERHEAVKKAFTVQKMIDPCIMFAKGGDDQEELMSFYFDKFNFHKKDLSPFINENPIADYIGKVKYSQREKNLSRRFITNKQSQRRIEKYNAQIE